LKAYHERLEKWLLWIGSTQAQAHNNDSTTPATNTNKVHQTKERQTTLQSNNGGKYKPEASWEFCLSAKKHGKQWQRKESQ
jgi:hypothetical protein